MPGLQPGLVGFCPATSALLTRPDIFPQHRSLLPPPGGAAVRRRRGPVAPPSVIKAALRSLVESKK